MQTMQIKGEQHYRATIDSSWGERDWFVSGKTIDEARAKVEAELEAHQSLREIVEREPRYGHTLIMGGYRWGSGVDLVAAKAEFRRQGGRLSNGYVVMIFDDETDFCGVDGMGSYHFIGNQPEQSVVEPRKR